MTAESERPAPVMEGFPPPPQWQVTPENMIRLPWLRWLQTHPWSRRPSAPVWRGPGPATPMARSDRPLGAIAVELAPWGRCDLDAYLQRSHADALLVLHRGRIVHETYLHGMAPQHRHAIASATKSLFGLIVSDLVETGVLDAGSAASRWVPELEGTPLGEATIDQLLDMRASFRFTDETHQIGTLQESVLQALGMRPRPRDYAGPDGVYALLRSARSAGPHGGAFRYDNGCTDTLGWVVRRATGRSLVDLVSERVWQPIGAEEDAGFALDTTLVEWAAAGLSATLRDLGRFGEMVRNRGVVGGRELFAPAVFDDLARGGDRAAFAASVSEAGLPGGTYRRHWWCRHDRWGGIAAHGQFAQEVYVAPLAEVVIVQLSSDPDTTAAVRPLRMAVFDAICARLAGG